MAQTLGHTHKKTTAYYMSEFQNAFFVTFFISSINDLGHLIKLQESTQASTTEHYVV
jgi:hypothetical protein